MSKKAFVGVDNKARKVKKIYVGVDGKARRVVKAYVGDENGKARQWWPSLVSKIIFNRYYGFDSYDFITYSTTDRVVQNSFVEYTKYGYVGSHKGNLLYDHVFDGFNVVELESSNTSVGPNNPVKYVAETEQGYSLKLEIPAGESYDWWLTIPILAIGVVEVEADVTGYASFEICQVGIATRVQDNTKEIPDYFFQSAQVTNQTVKIRFSTNSKRADFLYIAGTNFMGFGTRLRINEIKITCERPYGKVYNQSPMPFYPVFNVNFPRFGYRIGYSYAELMVTAATSAVYMLIYTTNNDFVGDHEYTDIENGDSWGTGTTFCVFISKNTFTLNWCQNTNIGPAQTIDSATIFGKTTYYFYYTVPAAVHTSASPMYNHAYNLYDALSWSDVNAEIAALGYEILYSGTVE